MSTKSAAVAEALDKPWTEAVRRGKVKTVEDARNNPAFSDALDAMIDCRPFYTISNGYQYF